MRTVLKNVTTLLVVICSFIFSSANAQVLDNGKIRVGTGAEPSLNNYGCLKQPWYWNASAGQWRKLTYSNRALEMTIGVGGDKTNEFNLNGELQYNPVLTNQTINTSNYVASSGSTGYGTITSSGTITINGQLLEVTTTYTLPQNSAFIKATVKLKNLSASPMQNVRMWAGTGDDWVGLTDGPTKTKGNLINGAFVPTTNIATRAGALEVKSGSEGVLFYTNSSRGNTGINYCCSFSNIVQQDPVTSVLNGTWDGSYGFYVRMNDLASGGSDEFSWYYAAGELGDLPDIISEVAAVSGAVQNISYRTAELNATTSVNSTGYWMVVPRNATAPTAPQISAGVNYGSVTVAASGSGAMTANVQRTFAMTGLNPATNYDVYFVSRDASNVYSAITSVPFTTLTCPAATITPSGPTTFCQGGSVTLTASSGTSYLWSNGSTSQSITVSQSGTYSVTIAQGSACSANTNIVVTVNAKPVITVSASGPTTFCPGGNVTLTASGANTYSWNTGATSPAITVNQTGSYTVTGSSNGCTSNPISTAVTAQDNIPPVIACPFNITVSADAEQCGANVTYTQPSATDNCGSGTLPTSLDGYTYKGTFGGHTYFISNVATTPEAAHAAAIGLGGHLVTINSLQENQFVSEMSSQFIWIGLTDRTVEGTFRWVTSEPVTYTNWNSGEPNNAGDEDWAVINWGPNGTWNDWTYSSNALYVVEFEGGSIPTTLVSGPASGSFFPVGTRTVTYSATDAGGNTATCSFTVTVTDNQRPVITTNGNQTAVTSTGGCSANVTVSASATDNCSVGVPVGVRSDNQSLNAPYPKGVTTISWNVTDVNNNAAVTAIQTVTVTDNQPPVLSPAANQNISLNTACSAVIPDVRGTATDNCGAVTITQSPLAGTIVSSSHNATVNVIVTATDATGLTTVRTVVLTAKDVTAPVLTPAANQTINVDGSCSVTIPDVRGNATDNCGTVTITQSPVAGTIVSSSHNGTINVIVTATDAAGLTDVKTVVITAQDVTPPVITCPASVSVNTDANVCGARVIYTLPTVTDNCSGTASGSIAYNYTGTAQTFTVPAGVTKVKIKAWGAQGADGHYLQYQRGGKGGYAEGELLVTPGSTIYVYVGGSGQRTNVSPALGGFNGGGNGYNIGNTSWFVAGGGGASDIRINGTSLTNRVIVAGGGGAAGGSGSWGNGDGGNGGGLTGEDGHWSGLNGAGMNTPDVIRHGKAGTQSAGGAAGTYSGSGLSGSAGQLGQGGNASTGNNTLSGGGGGGYYGGGGGAYHGGAGGGGSSYLGGVTNGITLSGQRAGNGSIEISWQGTVTIVTQTGGLTSGSLFPVGTTTNTFLATDAAGNTATCSFDVTVTDNQIPVITHNGNKNVLATAGRCDAAVNVSATASDNCVVGSPVGVRSDARPLSDPYPVGTTTITWNVTDANGNAAIAQTQSVTVTDNQKPVITGMPANITRNAVVNNCLALITWQAPTVNDNCGIASFSSSDEDYNSLGFTLLPVGVHTITYTATDVHGNVQTSSFTVTVVDNQNPIITGCPGTIALNNAPGTCGQQAFWNPPTASDNCPGVTMTGSHVPGSIFPVGTTVVTYTATDAAGLVTTCSFNVIVTDNEKPVVSNCPANITVYTGAGNITCRQTATWVAPTATDNCGNVTVSSTHQPGAIFAIGTTTVTYTFTDVHNNVNTCSFDVTVRDNTAPVPNVASLPTITAECSATASVPSATDNCGGVINGVPSGPISFTTQGTHTITWTYTDAAGNASSQTQTVVIDDNTPPVIACPFDIVVNATTGMCGAVVTYNQPSATDNCGGGNLPTSIPGYTYKGMFNGHSYFVSNTQARPEAAHAAAIGLGGHLATISDAAENALISGFLPGQRMWIGFTDRDVEGTYRWVTNEPITYTNWSGGEPNNAGDEDWAVINWSGPTWNDWYYEQPAYYVVEFEGGAIPTTLVSGPASGSVFPVGTTVVTWSATDAGGNTVTCSFNVTVKDVEAPRIICPSNINAIATSAAGAIVNYTEPVGTDNCSGAVTTRIAGPASGSTFPIGTTLVTYRVRDAAGLIAQCSFTVTVVGVPPAINCPANIIVNNTQGECGTNVSFSATETQAIPASTITYSQQPGSFFPVGTTTVTATATNPVGTSVCTFTVTVRDAEHPKLINVPSNETVECTEVPAPANVTATDNCGNLGAVQYTEVKADGNCAGNYTLTRTWSVTDAHNNTTTATQVITVVDTKAPVISAQAQNTTVECDGAGNTSALQGWLDNHGASAATDDCSGVTWTNNFNTSNWVADCGRTKHVTVVFTATDGCGNASNTTATFRIKDETAPAVATAAGSLDRVVECSDESAIAAANAMVPSATDDCSQITLNLVSDVTTPGCGSTYVRVRQWNFTDACGNTSVTYKQTITAKDETAPVISCPASVTLNCQDDNSTAATGVATATDNCSTPVVSYSDASTQSSNVNDAAHYNYTITRTWKAVDACNNESSCVQTITVQDITKPVITCPASVTVNCQDNNTSTATGKATATDNCGPVAITETQTSTQNANVNSPAYYNYTITRTWRATDVTGNYSECVQTITVQDITKPVAVCKPVTITLVNGSASITPQMVNGGSSDNCSPLTLTVSKSSFNCSNIGLNTVTLTVKDVSGNVSTCQATVTVVGEIPTCKITSVPTDNTYTGGNVNSLYLGYGAQSTTLKLDVPVSGAPYTFSWNGNGTLSSTTVQSPLFAPTTAGLYTFTVFITNKYGCTTSCTISICVTDVRVMNAKTGTWDGKKVYVCHVPPGNPGNSNTLEISVNAVPAHIGASGHGTDRLGKCEVAVCTAPVYARGGAPTEVSPQAYASEIKVYPNPTTGVFALLLQNYSKGKVEIQVVDNYGKLVANQSVTVMNQSENVTIDVTKHASGVYHVRVLSNEGVKTMRVVVAR